ncbi:MAG: sigma-70 family RNA polymerase sigma factor [Pseudomonadales bacterium]|nr:sigma-70 family RNA polymerase sigma factor [Pseudomonadales bacterium]
MSNQETRNASGLEQLETEHEALVNLIARCALRDQKALKQLYQLTAAFLNGVAFRILKDTEASNDVLQEAFVQIWSNAASYRPDKARPMTWLASIVRYRALDRLEKEQRRANLFEEEGELGLDQHSCSQPTPDQVTDQSQQSAQLQHCLGTLGEESRKCIELAYLLGFSRDEIADKMKTNVNTIKSWLRRGGEKLKLCLTNLQLETQ